MQRVWSTYLDTHPYLNSHQRGVGSASSSTEGLTMPYPMDRTTHNRIQNPSNAHSPSPRASLISSYSQSGSTRHILADMQGHGHNNSSSDFGGNGGGYGGINLNVGDTLQLPSAPFASGKRGSSISSTPPDTPHLDLVLSSPTTGSGIRGSSSGLSLSVNYLPQKFSNPLLSPLGTGEGTRKRRSGIRSGVFGAKGEDGPELNVPKRGGGAEAFRAGESRMPDNGTGQVKRKMRWNKFKWILFATNMLLSLYSLASLIVLLLVWFDVWEHADVLRTGNRPELVLSTLAASIGIFTSLIGWAGILLNNRSFLAWYTFLTWISFAFMLIPGYIAYKKRTFNLEGKINAQWSRDLGAEARLRIQNQLNCCGYYSPFVEATVSQTCYARSMQPGCKLPYMQFEKDSFKVWYTVVFSLVPAQIGVMLAGLLCSNHVTYRFGKGMMPERYRLNEGTMKVIWEGYVAQLADQYGADVVDDILKRVNSPFGSNTSLTLGGTPSLGYTTVQSQNTPYNDISMPIPTSPTTPTPNQSMPTPTHYGDGGKGMGMPEPQYHQEYKVGVFREHIDSNGEQTHPSLAPYHAKYNSLGAGEYR